MTPIEKLQKKLNIEISDTYKYSVYDLEITTYNTADGYEVYVMNNLPFDNFGPRFNWENDVFYYQPSFGDIISRITELDAGSKVYVDDIDEYMPDYEIEEWLNEREGTND